MRIKNLLSSIIDYLRFCLRIRSIKILHFFLFVLFTYIIIEWQHEDNLYINIGKMAEKRASSNVDTAIVTEAMYSISTIMHSRHDLFKDREVHSWKQSVFQSADIDLMYGSGACGGYSKVLARTLQMLGYKVRIGQLKTIKFGYGGHIIIEYYSNKLQKWVMMDPLFTWIPRTKNHDMASIKEVAQNWSSFAPSMPKELRDRFQFTDVRYTNWTRLGGLPKAYYHMAKFFMGKPYADTICIRMYTLSTFPLLFWSLETVYLFLLGIGYWRWKRR